MDTTLDLPSSSNENDVEIPRHVESNPFNYTEKQKAIRRKAIKDMGRDYPNLPHLWIEWLYDVIQNKPVSEVEEIMEKNLWDKPPENSYDMGGVVKAMTIE